MEISGFLLSNQNPNFHLIIALNKCVYRFELVTQVSDVAHGPLVNYEMNLDFFPLKRPRYK